MNELEATYDEMMGLYEDIKGMVRQLNPHLYERWKAGGFLVDEDVLCMYPNLGEVVSEVSEI